MCMGTQPVYLQQLVLVCKLITWEGLVTNYGEGGGLQNGRGGEHVKFYPYGKEGGGESISHIEGGAWGGGGGSE